MVYRRITVRTPSSTTISTDAALDLARSGSPVLGPSDTDALDAAPPGCADAAVSARDASPSGTARGSASGWSAAAPSSSTGQPKHRRTTAHRVRPEGWLGRAVRVGS